MIKCVLAGVQISDKVMANLMQFIENEKARAFEEGKQSASSDAKKGRPRKELTPEELEVLKIRQQLREQGLVKRGWVKGKPRKEWTPEELEARQQRQQLREQGFVRRGWAKGKPRKEWTPEELEARRVMKERREKRKELVEQGILGKVGWPVGKPRGTKAEREQAKALGITVEELRLTNNNKTA